MIKRNTIQRSMILAAVNEMKSHATAEEVYAFVAAEHPTISKATVYRNLNQLAETGAILKLQVPGGADRFDHQCHEHYHVRCLNCGQVFDVDMKTIPNLDKSIENTHGFQFSGHDIMFKGICPDCQTKQAHTGEPRKSYAQGE